jgi:hypothetical protein
MSAATTSNESSVVSSLLSSLPSASSSASMPFFMSPLSASRPPPPPPPPPPLSVPAPASHHHNNSAALPSNLRERENPTHAVLTNPDILELILENLSVDRVWELGREDVVMRRSVLASAALTCRTFLEPALDRLWKSLDKLFPLFKLLPAFYRSDSTFVSLEFLCYFLGD